MRVAKGAPAGGEDDAALAAADLPPVVLARAEGFALADLPGMIAPGDARLAALGVTVLGAYAAPLTA